MDKTRIKILGKQLRRAYVAPDDLPGLMRKALEQLAAREAEQESENCGMEERRSYAK